MIELPERWKQVQQLRLTHTQIETARLMGVSQTRIYQIEKLIKRKNALLAHRQQERHE